MINIRVGAGLGHLKSFKIALYQVSHQNKFFMPYCQHHVSILQSKLSRNEENIVKMCSIKEKPSRIKENKSVSSENIRVKYKEEDKNAAFANRIRELLEIAKRSDGIKPLLNTSSFKKGLIIEYNRNALRNNNTYNLTKKLQVKEDTIRQFSEIMKWGNNVEKYHKVNYY